MNGRGSDDIAPVLSYAAVGKGTVPEASEACRACGNSAFVAGHLGDLRTGMEESKRYRAQLQYKSSRVLSAPETERKHISKKLHYDTAPALTSIFVRLRFPETSTKDQEVRHSVEELREPTASALESVRLMTLDLRPAALDDVGPCRGARRTSMGIPTPGPYACPLRPRD